MIFYDLTAAHFRNSRIILQINNTFPFYRSRVFIVLSKSFETEIFLLCCKRVEVFISP